MYRTVKAIVNIRYVETDGAPRIYTHEEYGLDDGKVLQAALVYAINDLHSKWDDLNIGEVLNIDLTLQVDDYREIGRER